MHKLDVTTNISSISMIVYIMNEMTSMNEWVNAGVNMTSGYVIQWIYFYSKTIVNKVNTKLQ